MDASKPQPPDEIVALARQRTGARATGDWPRADALRAQIEAAGWKVIDRGTAFSLEPAAPPTVNQDGDVRYGTAADLRSVLDEAATSRFTVVLVADERPDRLARVLAALRLHGPPGTQVVVVANAPSPEQESRLAPGSDDVAPIGGLEPEVIRTSARLGRATALNVGLRRARGAIVILADGSLEPTGDALAPLEPALADATVAVVGAAGRRGPDLRRLGASSGPEVDVVDGSWLAFRRDDLAALGPGGPLDEKLIGERHLDTWWSLALRMGNDRDRPPRHARLLPLPLGPTALTDAPDRPADPREAASVAAHADRLARRAFYRTLDRFGRTPALFSAAADGRPEPD